MSHDETTEDTFISDLRVNTQAWVRVEQKVEALSERFGQVEAGLQRANAHLDNISRSSAQTAQVLAEMREDRLRVEEREHETQQDRRAIAGKVASELWSVSKQPLGLLVAAALAYFAYHHFEIPVTPNPVPVEVVGTGAKR